MSNEGCLVGDGLSRAIARADELRESSPRRVRVRIVTRHGDLDPGVIIVANIAAKTGPELEAQAGKGVRYVPLAELDARAHELPGLVEEAAAEVEALVAAAPAPLARPSRREEDFDGEAFEALIEGSCGAMLDAVKPLAMKSGASLSGGGVKEAIALAAFKVATLAAAGGQIELDDLIEMLRFEFRETRERAGEARQSSDQLH